MILKNSNIVGILNYNTNIGVFFYTSKLITKNKNLIKADSLLNHLRCAYDAKYAKMRKIGCNPLCITLLHLFA